MSAFDFRGSVSTIQRLSVRSRKTVGCLLQQIDHILTLRAAGFTAKSVPFLPTPDVCIFSPFLSAGRFTFAALYLPSVSFSPAKAIPLLDTSLWL
jgi:hypothetical protein